MSTADQYVNDFGQTQAEPRKKGWGGCLVGCLVVAAILLVVVALVAYWVSQNWRQIAADQGSQALRETIDASDFPPEEKADLKVQVDRVATAIRDGRLTMAQSVAILENLTQSPLMTTIVLMAAERQYIDPSGLDAEEKAEGKRSLERFLRGRFDGDIDPQATDTVMAHIADRKRDGTWELREQVTDADLRALLADAERLADEAGVAEEPEPIDASAEARRIVDEALGEEGPAAGEPLNEVPVEQAPTGQ